jgi:hypothetical protein
VFDERTDRDAPWWPETLRLVAEHTQLIHHRVGYDQGPQVNDVRDPAHAIAVQSHMKWWKRIWEQQKNNPKAGRGRPILAEMEFGPAPYMQTLPYTNQPVASQRDMNNTMRDMIKEAFYSM